MEHSGILVVGGGFSGITAALEAAEVGHEVFIVEKGSYLGGRVSQLNQYFPKLCPPSCGLEINFQRIKNNPKVKFFTMAEVVSVTGTPGNYTAKVKLSPRYVNTNCTGCDKCSQVCPVETDSEFEFGLAKRKAIYRPHLASFPLRYVIDPVVCLGKSCSKCVEACSYDAVDLDDREKEITLNVGSVIWATGWKPYDPKKLEILGAGTIKNAITNMQMERLASPSGPTNGQITRPSDGKAPDRIAFVQCAGSRDESHLPYCSYICCMASLKQVTYLRAQYPDAEIVIYYIDIRTPGRYDKFLQKIREDEKVLMVKGKVAQVTEDGATGDVLVMAEDIIQGLKKEERFNMVVLATGMEPSVAGTTLPAGMQQDDAGFCISQENGVFSAGCAKMPLDVMRSAQTATGAALKAIQTVVGR
ncbi:CoB--CoM heterodisulfide reductase iron-sulfur subunit A family protein [Desulfonatronum thioautotrophicum]|uniref:CoB--CoM heterodisulfide reductase iron-sulfur subunit A family protein n=1 Tax=Desulfonatronum thioautotrophicum TaxID=617001 RepID=UPI0005EB46D7|nr:CoB--CoM heterodisulfide reductase iron-sulfur subunit A family protein [Desulfonatronum thioautotrophicum]